ncbi:MAG: DNA mismatch repair protein MutS [Chloroflexota bacterium]|nr:DNA mismatch repair protein MutS [Chloroflexota bacterium]
MVSPLRKQYLGIKQQYPDVILFFHLGDFYETFDEDAITLNRVLEVTLTGRDMGKGERIPMAGVPVHAAESYIARLVAAGYRVAVCEQMEEPNGRAPVERKVTRVVTPGTVVEPGMLDAGMNNYLAACVSDDRSGRCGIAYADITTGEFACAELDDLDTLGRELLRILPAEALLPLEYRHGEPAPARPPWLPKETILTPVAPNRWRQERAEEALEGHFQVGTLEGLGLTNLPLAVRAAGAVVGYLEETQPKALAQMGRLTVYTTATTMTLDAPTRRNLELTESGRGDVRKSLMSVLNQTKTPMGSRLLRRWVMQPLVDLHRLHARQEAVAFFHREGLLRAELRDALKQVADVERLTNRALQGLAGPRELSHLARSLDALPQVREAITRPPIGVGAEAATSRLAPVRPLLARLPDCADLVELIRGALVDDPPAVLGNHPVIRPGYAPDLDELRTTVDGKRAWIATLETTERERTGIRSLKVGFNKVFGYFLEISNAHIANVPPEYLRKQTLVNAERYITPELKDAESIILTAEERIAELETAAYRSLLAQIGGAGERLRTVAESIAHLDLFAALAEVAAFRGYVRPTLDDGDKLEIVDGRHPVVEVMLTEMGETGFVPNDVELDDGSYILVITGPNMAGKSTYLRQVALIVLMAQIGSFVPAKSAHIGLVDRSFTRVGAQDDIATGQSTFMVEMVETAAILHAASPRSLVVLDEIGRGTSTYDGLAIAQATLEYLHHHPTCRPKTLFATHYHELTALADVLPRVRNAKVDVREDGDNVAFLHRVVPGGADRSYGIHVARLAGVPKAVVQRAEELLANFEAKPKPGLPAESLATAAQSNGGGGSPMTMQLTLFSPADEIARDIAALDPYSLTPIEALTKLVEYHERAKERTAAPKRGKR